MPKRGQKGSGHKSEAKRSVRNLQFGPQSRFAKGINLFFYICTHSYIKRRWRYISIDG